MLFTELQPAPIEPWSAIAADPCNNVAPVPKLANRTPLALVIDSFLVRTANYAIGDRDGSHLMLFDKFKYLAGNAWIGADVTTIH